MIRLRDDPGFWWEFRWCMREVKWAGLVVLLAAVAFMVWRVVAGW